MSFTPVRQCTKVGCTTLVKATDPTAPRCALHPYPPRTYQQQQRPNKVARGYDKAWERTRDAYIREHPICEIRTHCNGRPAKDVDHRVAIQDGGDRLSWENLQSACRPCHNAKTRSQQRLRRAGEGVHT